VSGRGKKKARDQVINKMFAGKISVAEARTWLDWKPGRGRAQAGKQAAAEVAKSAGPSLPQVWENHNNPQIRERFRDPVVMKSLQGTGGNAPPAARPAPRWTALDAALLRESREHRDPARRDATWRTLEQRGTLGWTPPGGGRQVQISVPPEMLGHLQLPGGLVI
jgi:hypothetical protein